jgi:S1-C subfamily serine protease
MDDAIFKEINLLNKYMLRWNRFLSVVTIGMAFTLNAPRLSAIALEPPIIQGKAAQFIVKIGGDYGGTGFFIRKNQNRYTILTNRHVIKNPSDYIIFTSDGRSYRFGANNIRVQPGVDLAEIEIQSTVEYPLAKLSGKIAPVSGSNIYTYGWNAVGLRMKSRGLQWLEGKITGQLPTDNSSDGYSLAYTLTAIRGLSGSPLLNEQGEVIGVYGSGEQEGIGLGIPIATYQNIALGSPPSPLSIPQIQAQMDRFVVRIDVTEKGNGSGFNGSGFIINKNGNTYTVLTNEHVVRNSNQQSITTPDGKKYSITAANIKILSRVDFAEITFVSNETYEVAKLSTNPNIGLGNSVYVYGWNRVSKPIYPVRQPRFAQGIISQTLPFENSYQGYTLVFSGLPVVPGLSGSPVCDDNGEVIGVYGLADGNNTGSTLGISIATYRRYAWLE